jgi:ricin-type beta-trefoil lectin protein
VVVAVLTSATALAAASPGQASAGIRYWNCAGGFLDPGSTPAVGGFALGLGQRVNIVIRNNNFLGLPMTVKDIYTGETHSTWVPPYSSRTVVFTKFGAEPIGYKFAFNTIAQSVIAGFGIHSYYCGRKTGAVRSGIAGKCMDVYRSRTADGTKVDIWTCNGGAAQRWTWGYANYFDGWDRTVRALGKCLDVRGSGRTNGTKVQLWTCNRTGAQRWEPQANGSLVNPQSGKCLDDPRSSRTNGTQLQIWTCNGTSAQRWRMPMRTIFLG